MAFPPMAQTSALFVKQHQTKNCMNQQTTLSLSSRGKRHDFPSNGLDFSIIFEKQHRTANCMKSTHISHISTQLNTTGKRHRPPQTAAFSSGSTTRSENVWNGLTTQSSEGEGDHWNRSKVCIFSQDIGLENQNQTNTSHLDSSQIVWSRETLCSLRRSSLPPDQQTFVDVTEH